MLVILSLLVVTPKVYYLFLHSQFHIKDLGMLKYFLGVEVMRNKQGILLSRRKYVLDLLSETGKLGAKLCSTAMTPNV